MLVKEFKGEVRYPLTAIHLFNYPINLKRVVILSENMILSLISLCKSKQKSRKTLSFIDLSTFAAPIIDQFELKQQQKKQIGYKPEQGEFRNYFVETVLKAIKNWLNTY